MQRFGSGHRPSGMMVPPRPPAGPSRSRRAGRAGIALITVVLTSVLAACAGVGGSATRVSMLVNPTAVSTPATPGSTVGPTDPKTSGGQPPTTPRTSDPGPTPPVAPPPCDNASTVPTTTPTGRPIITVTQGVNSWIANWSVEPLGLAVYADGTVIVAHGTGEAAKPLPDMTIGVVQQCVVDWSAGEIVKLAKLDMGDAGISDQGTTTLTYRPAMGSGAKISVYALGVGDEHVLSGKENRRHFAAVLDALKVPPANSAAWLPDRVRVVESTLGQASPDALKWPGPKRLEATLSDTRGDHRCGVLTGAAAAAVLKTLDGRPVYSQWTDAGKTYGLQVGALVPGQDGCTDTD